MYDPNLGRFLQTDPIGYADDQNLYTYVYNDPLNRTDATGQIGVFGTIGLGAVIGGVVGAGYEGYQQLKSASSAKDFNLRAIGSAGVKGALIGAAAGAGSIGAARLALSEGAKSFGVKSAQAAGAAYASGLATLSVSPAVDVAATGELGNAADYGREALANALGSALGTAVDGALSTEALEQAVGAVGRAVLSTAADAASATEATQLMDERERKLGQEPTGTRN